MICGHCSSFRFFDLPHEIRYTIYEMAFADSEYYLWRMRANEMNIGLAKPWFSEQRVKMESSTSDTSWPYCGDVMMSHNRHFQALLSNKQMYYEARNIFIKSSIFEACPSTQDALPKCIPRQWRPWVTCMSFTPYTASISGWIDDFQRLREVCCPMRRQFSYLPAHSVRYIFRVPEHRLCDIILGKEPAGSDGDSQLQHDIHLKEMALHSNKHWTLRFDLAIPACRSLSARGGVLHLDAHYVSCPTFYVALCPF